MNGENTPATRPSPRTAILALCAVTGLLTVTGCDQLDPLKRPYMWHSSGANAQNIAAMAANPGDLQHGRGRARHRALTESDAVDRVWSNRPTPLIGGGGAGAGAAAGAGAGGTAAATPPAGGT